MYRFSWLRFSAISVALALVAVLSVQAEDEIQQSTNMPSAERTTEIPRAVELELPEAEQEPAYVAAAHDALGRKYRGGMIVGGGTKSQALLLSFDDGPNLRYTPAILDILSEQKLRAVFFVVGERLVGNSYRAMQRRVMLRRIVEQGHFVGNHTYSHQQLTLLSDGEVRREIIEGEKAIRNVLGSRPWLFRYPGGAHSERVDAIVAELGYTAVLWNIASGDSKVDGSDALLAHLKSSWSAAGREQGGVVLFHDTHAWSEDGLAQFLTFVERRNQSRKGDGSPPFFFARNLDAFFVPRADAHPSALAPLLSTPTAGRAKLSALVK